MLLQINWTVSFAQTGIQDTTKCYGFTELRLISAALINGTTCDTLLANAKLKLANRDTMIKEKDFEISQYKSTNVIKDKFIKNREDSIAKQQVTIKKLNRKITWTKIGWATTTIIEVALIIYFMLR